MAEWREQIKQNEHHGVVFAIFDGHKIQLEKRKSGKYKGLTIVPGGGVEQGETIEEAVLREPLEEYGIRPTKIENLGTLIAADSVSEINYRHIYLITEWDGDLSDPEKGKSEHVEATLNDSYMLCDHPLSRKILDMVTARVLKVD